MAPFTDTAEVQNVLNQLSAWEGGPLIAKFPRQIGQREERYGHTLCGELPDEGKISQPSLEPARLVVMAENERLAVMETRVAALQDELERLKAQFSDFVKQFQ